MRYVRSAAKHGLKANKKENNLTSFMKHRSVLNIIIINARRPFYFVILLVAGVSM